MTVRLILWLFLCAAIPVSSAEPMYYCSRRLSRTPSTTRPSITRYIIARPVSSYRQRRPISNTNPYATRQQQQQPRDYSTIFLDVDEFQRDKKARIWQVNFKTRQPGKYSWATRLVIANVLCYLAQSWNPRITQMFVKDSAKILRGQELYRLLTPVFLHGGVAHLAMNMYSLRNIGPDVEKLFGPGRFLATYLGAGICGNLLSAINSPNPALGASGAVFGIIGAQLVFLSRNDWLLGQQGERMQSAILQTVGLNLVMGLMNPMIDNWGHLGGLVGGGAAAYYFGPRLHLMNIPEGGRLLVDRPIVRLPRSIESIPERISNKFKRATQRLKINQHVSDLPDKPWRNNQRQRQRQRQLQRQAAPNRSIKPKHF